MAQESYTHRYVFDPDRREKNLFKEEYFSSTDVEIYFDDKNQTEINYISFSLNEQLKPIYGYASRTWDDVAVGNRIVSGTFQMPINNSKEKQFIDFDSLKGRSRNLNASDNSDNESYNKINNNNQQSIEWMGTTEQYTDYVSGDEGALYNSDEYKLYLAMMANQGYVPKSDKFKDIKNSIIRYQKARGLEGTGKINDMTKEKLENDTDAATKETHHLERVNTYAVPDDSGTPRKLTGDFVVTSDVYQGYVCVQDINTGKHYYVKEVDIV